MRYWLLILLLVLTLTGAITLGDIFRVIFGIIGALLLIGLVISIVWRIRIARLRREAEARGEQFTGYTWHFGGGERGTRTHSANTSDEGRVRVSRTEAPKKKRVSKDVGEYVDFKEE